MGVVLGNRIVHKTEERVEVEDDRATILLIELGPRFSDVGTVLVLFIGGYQVGL